MSQSFPESELDELAALIWLAGFTRAFDRTPTDPWENQNDTVKNTHRDTARKVMAAGYRRFDFAQRPAGASDHDMTARACLRPIRGCATDEQYKDVVSQTAQALQDAFDLGFKAAGGSIQPVYADTSTDRPPLNQKTRCEECNLLAPCDDPKCPNTAAPSVSSPERGEK